MYLFDLDFPQCRSFSDSTLNLFKEKLRFRVQILVTLFGENSPPKPSWINVIFIVLKRLFYGSVVLYHSFPCIPTRTTRDVSRDKRNIKYPDRRDLNTTRDRRRPGGRDLLVPETSKLFEDTRNWHPFNEPRLLFTSCLLRRFYWRWDHRYRHQYLCLSPHDMSLSLERVTQEGLTSSSETEHKPVHVKGRGGRFGDLRPHEFRVRNP